MAEAPNTIVFDSGLGGLTVYREVAAALPQARYLYVADDAFFPYGGRDETALIARVSELMGELIYYLDPRRVPVVMWDWDRAPRNHYEIANRIDTKTGARVLFVSLVPEPTYVLQRFTRTEPLGAVTVYPDPAHPRTVYLFDLEGFKPR